ncbi:MAG: hypothetical protein NTW19_06495 [Planctomycetota bacterium]|nr:hypothetical protein [Planctomycetota bacterium]
MNTNPRAARFTRLALLVTSFITTFSFGCASEPAPIDPHFALTRTDAKTALQEMQTHPAPIARPIVVLAGWRDPGITCGHLCAEIEKITPDRRILGVEFGGAMTFDDCRQKVIAEVEKRFPSGDPQQTAEVDVIAVSMGGLVARHAAAPPPDDQPGSKRLRIARLFTLATPHRGAQWAQTGLGGPLERDMQPGSAFLARLDRERAGSGFRLFCYGRTRDWIVGIENTAPPGETAWRVEPPPGEGGHLTVFNDERIFADIARRLRGERAFGVGVSE